VIKTYLLLLLAVALSCASCAQKQNTGQVAIVFYNCENFFDNIHNVGKEDEDFTPQGSYHYTDRIYNQKLHNIAAVIQKMADDKAPEGPAIMGMAEVENDNVLNALVRQPEIAAKHYKYVWYNGPDGRGINVALLYNPKYFRVLQSEPLHVNLGGTGGKETTRDILHVYGILAGDTVHVFVNHWPSRRGGEDESDAKRAVAAGVCRAKVDEITKQNPTARIIVMGDLNDNPVDVSVANVLKAKEDKNNVSATELYDPWAAIYKSGTGTLEYKHHWDLFDQIIISGSFLKNTAHKLHFNKAEIFKPDLIVDHYGKFEGYPHRSFAGTHWINGYSDHFPVMVYLSR
jgi:predicted extracellular nuclease